MRADRLCAEPRPATNPSKRFKKGGRIGGGASRKIRSKMCRAAVSRVASRKKTAKALMATYSAQAYDAAATSSIATKGAEAVGTAYQTVVTHPTVLAVAGKTEDAAGVVRAKLSEKLVELRKASPSPEPVGNGV